MNINDLLIFSAESGVNTALTLQSYEDQLGELRAHLGLSRVKEGEGFKLVASPKTDAKPEIVT